MNQCSRQSILFWINQINDYLRSQKFQIDPLPEIVLVDESKQKNDPSNVFISTGGYQPYTKTVILYIDNRHIKDILRSYCHEMVHHNQNLDNEDYLKRVYKNVDLVDSPELEEIESEAFLKGNLLFRKFTEKIRKKFQKSNI